MMVRTLTAVVVVSSVVVVPAIVVVVAGSVVVLRDRMQDVEMREAVESTVVDSVMYDVVAGTVRFVPGNVVVE